MLQEWQWILMGFWFVIETGIFMANEKGKGRMNLWILPMVSFLIGAGCFPLLLETGLQNLVKRIVVEQRFWSLLFFFLLLLGKLIEQRNNALLSMVKWPFLSVLGVPVLINGFLLMESNKEFWQIALIGCGLSAVFFLVVNLAWMIWIKERKRIVAVKLIKVWKWFGLLCCLLWMGTLEKGNSGYTNHNDLKINGVEWLVVLLPVGVGMLLKRNKNGIV